MRDSRRAILSQFNTRTWHRAASLRGVQIVHYNEPPQTTPSAITTYANINRWKRFDQCFVWFISFILDRKRFIALSVRQTSSPYPPTWYLNIWSLNRFYQFFALFISFSLCRKRSSALSVRQTSSPYPPARYLKTLYTDNLCYLMMHIQDGRLVIVSAQRVQVRSSGSKNWLGGRVTPPRGIRILFLLSFLLFPLIIIISIFFFPFSFLYFSYLVSFWATLTFFLNKVLVLVGFFFLSLFQDLCCLTYQYYSDNYQSGGAAEGRRLQQHPYFYALRSHGFRVKSTILPSQFLATIFSGRIAPLEQAVEYVFLF